jgi:outer membrane protein
VKVLRRLIEPEGTMAFTIRCAATTGMFLAVVSVARPLAAAPLERAAAQGTATPAPTVKVGCVNLAYIAANSRQGKVELGELETFTRTKQVEIAERAKMLAAQEARLRSEAATLSEPARVELERAVRKAQLDFARFREDVQADVQQFAERVEQALRARLFPIVDEISKEKGLTLVFTVDAPGLVWFSPALDVSQDVVERLDRTSK